MPAPCVRTTRPATATELATLRERGKARGMLGCMAVPAVCLVAGAIAVASTIGVLGGSVSPAFAIELEGGRTLLLLGQWLSEEATFGGTRNPSLDDDAGEPFANALPPPHAFPTRAFTVHRFPISGEGLRIELTGPYVEPSELNLDLRSANGYPSRIYDVVPSKLVDVIPRTD
jgi:hypothetical protein